ncbi:MAG: hypothetical protein QGM50_08485 [Anaerolineae bacterium]|nr:hypothetical protein [Anaerolineae bacterium]MDK1081506.1 hypothetical protein [Anaerolineae bacterium]MDK1118812.1 hypothetical protein [Anaerolineae bacterium]
MSFLKKLFGLSASQSNIYTFSVQCERCNETIEGRVNLYHDLSIDDAGGYHVRKVLMGSGHCFQQVEVILNFSTARRLQNKEIIGGKFVEE